jgi:arylsulfatase A-like enzyme
VRQNYYDNGVRQADAFIQMILEMLSEKGYLEKSVVLVTGDHGELLGEQNLWAHASTVYEPVVRVPFLFRSNGIGALPKANGNALISQIDFAPTLLRQLMMPIPNTWLGQDVFSDVPRTEVQFQQGWDVGFVRVDSRRKVKYTINLKRGEEALYDLAVDPYESNDLIATTPKSVVDQWRTQLMLNVVGQ